MTYNKENIAIDFGSHSIRSYYNSELIDELICINPFDTELGPIIKKGKLNNLYQIGTYLVEMVKKTLKIKRLNVFTRHFDIIVPMCYDYSKTELDWYYELLEGIHAQYLYILPDVFFTYNGLEIPYEDKTHRLIMDIGAGKTSLKVVSSGRIVDFDFIDIAGYTFNEHIKFYLSTHHNIKTNLDECENLKIKYLSRFNTNETFNLSEFFLDYPIDVDINSISELFNNDISMLINKISHFINGFEDHVKNEVLNEGIFIEGGGKNIIGFLESLSNNFKIHPKSYEDTKFLELGIKNIQMSDCDISKYIIKHYT